MSLSSSSAASRLVNGTPSLSPAAWGEGGGHTGDGGAGDEGGGGGGDGVGRRFLASGSRDKTVKLWNATVGQCLMTFVSWRGVVVGDCGACGGVVDCFFTVLPQEWRVVLLSSCIIV